MRTRNPTAPRRESSRRTTVVEALARSLRARGVRRMFGIPGGESSLDLIEAARRAGIGFVLARHESAAGIMAAASAEVEGRLGVVIATRGPGTANAANGMAQAALDRNPVALVTDGFSAAALDYVTHQWFDQRALLAPLAKGHALLEGSAAPADIERLLVLALAPRRGPVHLELTGAAARTEVAMSPAPRKADKRPAAPDRAALERARALLATARRPLLIAGLEAAEPGVAAPLRRLLRALRCPALLTYKAKGVVADADPRLVGLFTGGAAERGVVGAADLIVTVGLDPVELIPQPWGYAAPVLELSLARHPVRYVDAAAALFGDLAASLNGLAPSARRGAWPRAEIATLRASMRARLAYRGTGGGLSPQAVVEEAARVAAALPGWPRATVDAGAHMFCATAFWPCRAPRDLLISNGLATMGFALPAAIASALADPRRTTLAFTGDGGLAMCLGELVTAVETGARVVIVVFNDAALSLIDIKQQQRRLAVAGVRGRRVDFALAMRAAGGWGVRVRSVAAYRRALEQAFAQSGPALIDVAVDPSGYLPQMAALRG
jgi:acetolactate synthase-1/2/3 large subunit